MAPSDMFIRDITRRYLDHDRACFIMTWPGEGVAWPPREDAARFLLRNVGRLRISWVNPRYLEMYAFPATGSPLGCTMAELAGSPRTAAGVLKDFYDGGGHTRARMLRRRMDGSVMLLEGEYRMLQVEGRIIGHYGIEEDITTELVAPGGDELN